MARQGATPDTEETMNSASSQFFIVHEDAEYLDGNYASFGEVLEGIELVDDITNVRTNEEDKPINKIIINSIRFVNAYEKVNSLNYEIYEKNEKTLYKIEDKVYKEVDGVDFKISIEA